MSGVDVPLEGPGGSARRARAQATTAQAFSPVDVQFLQGVANVLAGALVRDRRERRAVDQALHCPLTGLPTRTLFDDRFEHALERVRRGTGQVALLMVDLDRFKHVNDVWGHLAGDEVLRVLDRRLVECARTSDTVARFGGDEFVVLCEDEVTHVGVARVAAADPPGLRAGLRAAGRRGGAAVRQRRHVVVGRGGRGRGRAAEVGGRLDVLRQAVPACGPSGQAQGWTTSRTGSPCLLVSCSTPPATSSSGITPLIEPETSSRPWRTRSTSSSRCRFL